jgi:hypothetical protein
MEKKNSCRYLFSGCVSVDDETTVRYFNLRENGFDKIINDGKTPLAVDADTRLYALKGMNDDGITIEIKKEETSKTIDLDPEISSVISGCFLGDGAFAMLLVNEESTMERSFVVAVSDAGYSKWTGYTLKEENTRELFSSLLSLGAVLDRPASLQCYGDNIYVISHRIFSDMMNAVVFKLDRTEKKLEYVTGYHPIKTKGKVSIYFQEKDETLYVYSESKLTTVKGLNFPVDMTFNEPGEMLFSKDKKDSGTYLYFVPDNKAPGESKIRKIHF